jgi:uncharacterized protein (UPF0147 family)
MLARMSKRRERETLTRLQQVVGGVSVADEAGIARWVETLKALPNDEGRLLAQMLLRAYRHGVLRTEGWEQLTGSRLKKETELDDGIRRLWDALAEADMVKPHSIDNVSRSPRMLKRWAWQRRWLLDEQDEDLFLMADQTLPVLFEIAADPEVPKRNYLLEIVGHAVRDHCCHAAWHGKQLSEQLGKAAALAPRARQIDAVKLAEYLERLGSYRDSRPVDEAGALQRLLDLARCSQPPPAEVQLERIADAWRGKLKHSSGDKLLRIDAATGAITLAE